MERWQLYRGSPRSSLGKGWIANMIRCDDFKTIKSAKAWASRVTNKMWPMAKDVTEIKTKGK